MSRVQICGYQFTVTGNMVRGSYRDRKSPGIQLATHYAEELQRQFTHATGSFTYIFTHTNPSLYKIGVASNPYRRLLECYGADEVLCYCFFNQRSDAFVMEKWFHWKFKDVRKRGTEWFYLTQPQLSEAMMLMRVVNNSQQIAHT